VENRNALGIHLGNNVCVLSVSPIEADHLSMERIIAAEGCRLRKAGSLAAAWSNLRDHDIGVVVCERDVKPGTWVDMLEHLRQWPNPPSLIVTSRLADERLWSEALNLGAWDVLAKPFDRIEVLRSVKSAWNHWFHRFDSASSTRTIAAAG